MTVSEKLRLVQGLHSHAEMFGFNWNDDSDWTWHDVACKIADEIDDENAKLRELVQGLHMAYVGALNECESMDVGLIWEHCEMVDAELAKSHARFEADRHRFDVAMRELGLEVE